MRPAAAIDRTHIDTFSDGTNMDWSGGTPPVVISSGGPGGAADTFIQQTSNGGSGPNSRMATENSDERWVGNYLAAGVTGIELDFLNRGSVPLEMRAVLFNGRSNRLTSSVAALIPGDGLWHHTVFSLAASDMTVVLGGLSYTQLLGNADNLMFRHNSGAPSAEGTAVASVLGIDNIHPIPAPGAAALLAVAGLGLTRRRRGKGA